MKKEGGCVRGTERTLTIMHYRANPASTGHLARYALPEAQARSTSNAATLRASLLNSTAIRWIGTPVSRYLSA